MRHTKTVVITGPESTGKSTLTKQLGDYFNMPYILEIARNYVQNLDRKYNKSDVIEIAKLQIITEQEILRQKPEFVFIDTDLIITKIWLQHVYNDYPTWVDEYLQKTPRHCHLLCYFDLEWKSDPVRENPDLREYLFNKYKAEVEKLSINYHIIKGKNKERLNSALRFLQGI